MINPEIGVDLGAEEVCADHLHHLSGGHSVALVAQFLVIALEDVGG